MSRIFQNVAKITKYEQIGFLQTSRHFLKISSKTNSSALFISNLVEYNVGSHIATRKFRFYGHKSWKWSQNAFIQFQHLGLMLFLNYFQILAIWFKICVCKVSRLFHVGKWAPVLSKIVIPNFMEICCFWNSVLVKYIKTVTKRPHISCTHFFQCNKNIGCDFYVFLRIHGHSQSQNPYKNSSI